MREYKFRAWHKNNKSMCQNIKTDLLDRDYLEFMQFTEKRDRDKTEIYDKDVIQVYSLVYVIFYSIEDACWCCRRLDDGKEHFLFQFDMREVKVIGNEYEGYTKLE